MLKRLLDIVISALTLLFLLPLMALIAIAVLLSMGRPVFFRQERPGLWGKPFQMVKFRTMKDAGDEKGHPLPDHQRLTQVGRFLRTASLDELPELWNVLKGDMSLVGPRPLLMEYLPRYNAWQYRRHEVRPGVTGWAQINGRNALSWEEKFDLDVWYVDHHSLCLDIRILILTAVQVIRPKGISAEGEATMPFFYGSEHNNSYRNEGKTDEQRNEE
ncbi:lipopolysaccharide/colanic/teichoic acid biosynthesis glycosyltransferase [Halospina denitrificans]|uniref:Lipopolysaccharide/colanic/teichoic acid biosynthesis glycosyltransferase n=1 Tax=Halospina denitrificans TaxID=332522 RepID=A0A4R7JY91_9GAMM|nr:sugar transferase [Halospina denitrificans]TDT43472.1 lipopolysaccharide/colanic/teichoic acid biosynthesis glycosyltransferase [Halospina denitrificans]